MTKACLLPHSSCLGDQSHLPQASPDVSRRLAAELLTSIFIRIARDSYIDEKYSHSTPTAPDWVNVSYVCRYGREVALNSPTLWSYIPATSQCWTQELLARSQMAPLKISTKGITRLYSPWFPIEEIKARMLSIAEQVINHSQRTQKLHLDVAMVSQETSYQILSKFLFTHAPCLQHLEISYLDIPREKSWMLLQENTPALRTLRLKHCSVPWNSLGSSVLTTLHLSYIRIFIDGNTMAEFLAMLRRTPNLVQLSIENSLPNASNFLSNEGFNATPMISLPHLSNMTVAMIPLSAAIALLSCVDIPLMAKVQLEAQQEKTSQHISTLDEYVRLASLLAQRISQSSSPKFRSLTIGGSKRIALVFSTSERVECYSTQSLFSIGSDDNALLKVNFVASASVPMPQLDHTVLSSICSVIPLTNIQSVHFLGLPPYWPDFWKDTLASLSDVRHIRFSRDEMPNITSMLFLPSHPLTRSRQDGRANRGQGDIFILPALEELELYQTTIGKGYGSNDSDPHIADMQDLYDAISTRKETRCRFTINECCLVTDGGRVEALDSVGWWEGDQFRVTYNV